MLGIIDLKDFLNLRKPFFIILDDDFKRGLIRKAIEKAGTQEKLANILNNYKTWGRKFCGQDVSRIFFKLNNLEV